MNGKNECPDCGNGFYEKCGCGYQLPYRAKMQQQAPVQQPLIPPLVPLNREQVKQRVEGMYGVTGHREESYDYLAWAKVLRTKYLNGEKLLLCQTSLASGALNETWKNGQVMANAHQPIESAYE